MKIDCPAFQWVGQPITSCDNCGLPAWFHDYDEKPSRPYGPFVPKTWPLATTRYWLDRGLITEERFREIPHGEPCTDDDPPWARERYLRCTDPDCEGRDIHRGQPIYHSIGSPFNVNDPTRRSGYTPEGEEVKFRQEAR